MGRLEAGQVFFPPSSVAPWVEQLEDEFASFPAGAHDDQVDAWTIAMDCLPADGTQNYYGGDSRFWDTPTLIRGGGSGYDAGRKLLTDTPDHSDDYSGNSRLGGAVSPSVLCTLASRRYRSTVNPSTTASSGSCSNPGDRGGCGRGARSAGTGVRALLWWPGPPPNPPRPRATYREAVQSARTRCLINRQRNTARTFASRLEDTGSQAPVFVRGPAPRIPLLGNWQNRASYFQKFSVVPWCRPWMGATRGGS